MAEQEEVDDIDSMKNFDESKREGLLRRYGSLIKELDGMFYTAPDVGTTSADMGIIAETGAGQALGCIWWSGFW